MINSYITSTYLLHLSVGVYYIFNNNNKGRYFTPCICSLWYLKVHMTDKKEHLSKGPVNRVLAVA